MSNLSLAAVPADGAALTNAFLTSWKNTLEGYLNPGASLEAAQMKDRYVTSYLTWNLQANIGAATVDLEHTLQAGVEVVPVRLTVRAAVVNAGALTLNVFDDGVSILSGGALSVSNATEQVTENFTGAVAGSSVLRFRFIGDGTPWNGTNVHAVLVIKQLIRA